MSAEVRMRVSATDDASGTIKKIQREMYGLKSGLDNFGRSAMALGTVGIVGLFTSMASSSLDAYLQLEKLNRAYTTIGGSTGAAAKQLEFIRSETERLGLSFVDSAEQAKGFFASVKGTVMGGEVAQGIFTGVSEAGSALGLSSVDMDRAFRALGQIAGKGKVMAEELRGQLGEVVPGAFQIAARAMGMTTAELDKFMAEGKLLADDFLPRFGDQLKLEFADGAEKASHTVQASINRMSSSWTEFKANILNSETMMATFNMVNSILSGFNASTKDYRDKQSVIKGMEEAGYAKQSYQDVSYGFDGTKIIEEYKRYSTEQIEEYRESQKQLLAEQAKADAVSAQAEKTLGENRKRINESYAKSAQGQRQALLDEHTQTLQSFDGMIADYQRQGTDTASLLSQRSAVVDEYKKKLAGLDKKASGPSTDSARIALQGINAEIAKLEGRKSDSFAEGLEKKLMEIARKGKEAKLSLQDIESLQSQYKNAAQGDLQRRQSVTLQKLEAETAAAFGDNAKASILELEEGTRKWREELQGLGLDMQAAQPLLDQWAASQQQKNQVKDAETAASFYKELGDLSGSYGLSIQHQNELLRLQADNLVINVGITRELAGEWLRLKELEFARDPMSGLERGMRKSIGDATNSARQMEEIFSGTFQTIGNIGGTALEEVFDKGTFAVDKFFINLTRQLTIQIANAATNQMAGAIFGLIGKSIGGLFGGSMFGGAYQGGIQDVPRAPGSAFSAKGNVFAGGDISAWSGSVVDKTTVFSGTHLRAYAMGGNVMGEKGAEGIFPLKRGRDGKLGVGASFDYANLARFSQPSVSYAKAPQITINPTVIDRTERGVTVEMKEQRDNNGNVRLEYIVGDMAAKQANTPGSNLNRSLTRNGMGTPAIRR